MQQCSELRFECGGQPRVSIKVETHISLVVHVPAPERDKSSSRVVDLPELYEGWAAPELLETRCACGQSHPTQKNMSLLSCLPRNLLVTLARYVHLANPNRERVHLPNLLPASALGFKDMPQHQYQLTAILYHTGSPTAGHCWANVVLPRANGDSQLWTANDAHVIAVDAWPRGNDGLSYMALYTVQAGPASSPHQPSLRGYAGFGAGAVQNVDFHRLQDLLRAPLPSASLPQARWLSTRDVNFFVLNMQAIASTLPETLLWPVIPLHNAEGFVQERCAARFPPACLTSSRWLFPLYADHHFSLALLTQRSPGEWLLTHFDTLSSTSHRVLLAQMGPSWDALFKSALPATASTLVIGDPPNTYLPQHETMLCSYLCLFGLDGLARMHQGQWLTQCQSLTLSGTLHAHLDRFRLQLLARLERFTAWGVVHTAIMIDDLFDPPMAWQGLDDTLVSVRVSDELGGFGVFAKHDLPARTCIYVGSGLDFWAWSKCKRRSKGACVADPDWAERLLQVRVHPLGKYGVVLASVDAKRLTAKDKTGAYLFNEARPANPPHLRQTSAMWAWGGEPDGNSVEQECLTLLVVTTRAIRAHDEIVLTYLTAGEKMASMPEDDPYKGQLFTNWRNGTAGSELCLPWSGQPCQRPDQLPAPNPRPLGARHSSRLAKRT